MANKYLLTYLLNINSTEINVRFVESYKHLSYPLDGLVNYLQNKDTNIQSIKSKFSSLFQYCKDDAKQLSRKGVFPYDYMDEDWKNKF